MSHPREMFETMTEALGVDMGEVSDQKSMTVSSYEPKDVIKFKEGEGQVKDIDAIDDYDYARRNLHQLAEQGQEALNAAIEVASATGSSESFETVANLMKASSEILDKLVGLQEKMAKIAGMKKKLMEGNEPEEETSSTTNNIFVGSSMELMEFLEKNGIGSKGIKPRTIDQ